MTHRKRRAGPKRKEALGRPNADRRSEGRKSLERAAAGFRIWLVEQCLTGLVGEYLTEAMVLAGSEKDALDAACSLTDSRSGFGLVVGRRRLRAIEYGPAPEPLPAVCPRHRHRQALVLVVGIGADDGSLPKPHN
jgi:hypothetical protein